MKKYRLPCVWEMYGYVEVEADCLANAEDVAQIEAPLPSDAYYVEDSFEIDRESDIYRQLSEEEEQ